MPKQPRQSGEGRPAPGDLDPQKTLHLAQAWLDKQGEGSEADGVRQIAAPILARLAAGFGPAAPPSDVPWTAYSYDEGRWRAQLPHFEIGLVVVGPERGAVIMLSMTVAQDNYDHIESIAANAFLYAPDTPIVFLDASSHSGIDDRRLQPASPRIGILDPSNRRSYPGWEQRLLDGTATPAHHKATDGVFPDIPAADEQAHVATLQELCLHGDVDPVQTDKFRQGAAARLPRLQQTTGPVVPAEEMQGGG